MKEHHLHWYQLQGQNLSLSSHGILAGNHGSDQALLGKFSQPQKHKIIWSDSGTLPLKGNLPQASKGTGKGPSCLSLALDKDDENTQSSSKINTFGRYQQNLQFCALAPGQAGRQPAGVFCMPNIPKHCGKIFPAFLSQSCLFSKQ